MNPVNIADCFEKFDDLFSPKIVGEVNDQLVKVVRCEGDKVPWHIHDNEDELFFVLDGTLEVMERNDSVILKAGEFYVVKRGVEHKVIAHDHVKLMLIEPATTKHTGDVDSEITKTKLERIV